MAFVKKTWKDRIVQYANRRLLTKSGGEVEQVTVTRDEGTISEAGDQFNASNMNDLENRVNDGFSDLTQYVDDGLDEKADTSSLPVWVLQKSGTSIQVQVIATFYYYYATQWQCHVPFPFVCKNNTYQVTLDEILAENVGNVTSKCTLQSKSPCFCDIRTDNTMGTFPNQWSTCMARCKITITFA